MGADDTFEMAGTVKKHDMYRDTKQTVLTRIKKIDPPKAAVVS